MARGVKKEKTALTQEEKLARALVPVEEQPYKVPGNWCWVTIGSILNLQAGKNISASKIENVRSDVTPYPCFGGNGIRGFVSDYNKEGEYPIIGRQGALCGNLNWASGRFYATEHAVVVECPKVLNKRWAFYFLDFMNLNQYATATAQPGLAVGNLIKLPLSVPPLAEQQRIVDRIESLFAKLDEAKEKAQAVVDSFEKRKAAILHKAFTGELTKQWRERRGLSISSWETLSFGELANDVRLGLVRGKAEQAADKRYGYIKMNNISMDGLVDLDGLVRVDASADEVLTYSLCPGDFLFNTRNSFELVGKNAVWQFSEVKDILFNNNIMRVRFQDNVVPQFISHYLNSAEGKRDLEKVKKNTTNIAAIYAKDLNKIRIPLPPKEEQDQICLVINSIIDSLQTVREAAKQTLAQIDAMKKSILARAFRGELGTNDPADESAEALLKSIL